MDSQFLRYEPLSITLPAHTHIILMCSSLTCISFCGIGFISLSKFLEVLVAYMIYNRTNMPISPNLPTTFLPGLQLYTDADKPHCLLNRTIYSIYPCRFFSIAAQISSYVWQEWIHRGSKRSGKLWRSSVTARQIDKKAIRTLLLKHFWRNNCLVDYWFGSWIWLYRWRAVRTQSSQKRC